jgi:uncharacterized protein HemY
VRAGDHAQQLHANAEALAHFEAAQPLGNSDTIRLHEAIGDLHTLRGAYSLAAASYELAAAQASPHRRIVLDRKFGSLCVRQGAWERAESHFRAALSPPSIRSTSPNARACWERVVWRPTGRTSSSVPSERSSWMNPALHSAVFCGVIAPRLD